MQLKNYFSKTSYKRTKTTFKKIIEDIKSQEFKYIYTIKQIYITLLQLNDNKDVELWVKYIDFIKTNISINEVENIFKEAINKATKDIFKETFYLLYAKILKENNEIDKAIELLLDGHKKINKENILFALVKLYDIKKLFKESISLLEKSKEDKKNENSHQILIYLIKEYINIDDLDKALLECNQGINKFEKIDEFYLLKADILCLKSKDNEEEKTKNLEIAANSLRDGIKKIPQSHKIYIKLSDILFKCGQFNQARAILDRGLSSKNNENCASLYKEQILLELKLGNKNVANNLLYKALKSFKGTKDENIFEELDKKINENI